MAFASRALIDLVDAVNPDGPPDVRFALALSARSGSRRIGILSGSFNPPTDAHLALARSGRAAGLNAVVYVLGKRTIDKERAEGIPLADRLQLLVDLATPFGDAVAFVNRGLYVDQAALLRSVLPDVEIAFLVGFDKIVQIFDARYYDDRDEALDRLFALASFLVAPRGTADETDLAGLLAAAENRRYAAGIRSIGLAAQYREASSTRIRRGEADDVPDAVRAYLDRYRPYGSAG